MVFTPLPLLYVTSGILSQKPADNWTHCWLPENDAHSYKNITLNLIDKTQVRIVPPTPREHKSPKQESFIFTNPSGSVNNLLLFSVLMLNTAMICFCFIIWRSDLHD